MKKRYILIACLWMMTAPAVFGREGGASRHAVAISWGASIPLGADHFMNRACWISPAVNYEYKLTGKFSLAASLGYEYGQERGVTGDRYLNDLLDGYTTRSLSLIPVQVQLFYFPRRNRQALFQPYLGVGGGVSYARFEIEGDLISPVGKSNWGETFAAQGGMRYALGSGRVWLDAALCWKYAGNEFAPMHVKRLQNVGVRIGMIFGL